MDTYLAWLSGLVDGEGSFGAYWQAYPAKKKHPPCAPQLHAIFTIGLRADDASLLHEVQRQLAIGRLYPKKGGKTFAPQLQYRVTRIGELVRLVSIFDEYPLRSKKARDFQLWRQIVLGLQLPPRERDMPFLTKLTSELRECKLYTP